MFHRLSRPLDLVLGSALKTGRSMDVKRACDYQRGDVLELWSHNGDLLVAGPLDMWIYW